RIVTSAPTPTHARTQARFAHLGHDIPPSWGTSPCGRGCPGMAGAGEGDFILSTRLPRYASRRLPLTALAWRARARPPGESGITRGEGLSLLRLSGASRRARSALQARPAIRSGGPSP